MKINLFCLGKARRIKQAREQAANEIELYRKERERQFKEYEVKYMGSKEDAIAKIEKGTEAHLIELEENVQKNKEGVIIFVIAYIFALVFYFYSFNVSNLLKSTDSKIKF